MRALGFARSTQPTQGRFVSQPGSNVLPTSMVNSQNESYKTEMHSPSAKIWVLSSDSFRKPYGNQIFVSKDRAKAKIFHAKMF